MIDRLVLVGMMGSGKSTVGRELADLLGWRFVDSDAMVEAATGSTVAELFAAGGEDAFRDDESLALAAALASPAPVVVAAGGGAVLRPTNRELLATSGAVVWLRADPATLAGRVGSGVGRPLLGAAPAPELAALDAIRRPLYAEVADVVVDVDGVGSTEVAGRILAATGLDRSRT